MGVGGGEHCRSRHNIAGTVPPIVLGTFDGEAGPFLCSMAMATAVTGGWG